MYKRQTVATGYITTADYTGVISSAGVASIEYTVTYLGTPIVVEEEETISPIIPILLIVTIITGGAVLLFALLLRKNTTVYAATGNGNEYDKCGCLRLKVKTPELRIDSLKNVPEGVIAIEVNEKTAKKLFGKRIGVRYYDTIKSHTVGTVSGPYWFKMDVGAAPVELNEEAER